MKYIAIDVGGVLIKERWRIFEEELLKKGVSKHVDGTVWAPPGYFEFSLGEIDEEEFISQMNQFYDANLSVEEYRKAHDTHMFALYDEVVAMAKILHTRENKKYKIVIVTDTNHWQTKHEQTMVDVTTFSDRVFRSHEIHKMKKDPDYFPWLCDELSCSPTDILLIDDSLEKIENAKKHGLDTIHFKNAEQLRAELGKRKLLD